MYINEQLLDIMTILSFIGIFTILCIVYVFGIEPGLIKLKTKKQAKIKEQLKAKEELQKLKENNIILTNNILALELELKDIKKKVGVK